MATLGITVNQSNVLPAGIATWKVKWGVGGGETVDDAFYSLGLLADGKVVQSPFTQKTGRLYDKPVGGLQLDCSAKMLCTDKVAVLQKLHLLGNAHLKHAIVGVNGKVFTGDFGTKWRFDSSADYNGARYVEIMADYRMVDAHASLVDWADVQAGSEPATGTPDAGDSLYAFAPATIYPAGISSFTFDPAGDAETAGLFRNAKLTAELLTNIDSHGCSRGYGVKIDFSAEMMQTDEEMAFIDDSMKGADSFVITLADGTIFTLASKSGIAWDYHLEGNADSMAYIRIVGGGVVLLSEWAALIS